MRIFEYAMVANWQDRLRDLAEMSERERWTFRHVPSDHPLPVLESYIRYTFLRVYEQNSIIDSLSGRNTCFNTGLLTPGQEEIYAVFKVSDNFDRSRPVCPQNKKWFLSSWARSGDRILTDFMELPRLAAYWNDPAELVFDPKLQVQLNLDHIIRDNLNRFPEELGGKVDKKGAPTDLADEEDDDAQDIDRAPQGSGISESQPIPLPTRNALEGAMKHSIRLAQRSYRIAVPQFHKGRIQLLLPLYLRDSPSADLALTLEKHGGWYRAATVLYPDWAYMHARLLARPNSEWLGGFRADVMAEEAKNAI
jgi:hypothetical protein